MIMIPYEKQRGATGTWDNKVFTRTKWVDQKDISYNPKI